MATPNSTAFAQLQAAIMKGQQQAKKEAEKQKQAVIQQFQQHAGLYNLHQSQLQQVAEAYMKELNQQQLYTTGAMSPTTSYGLYISPEAAQGIYSSATPFYGPPQNAYGFSQEPATPPVPTILFTEEV